MQWEDEGFKPVVDIWSNRREETKVITLKKNRNQIYVVHIKEGYVIENQIF